MRKMALALCALLLMAAPALAHGDEQHGQTEALAEQPAQVTGGQEIAPASANDAAANDAANGEVAVPQPQEARNGLKVLENLHPATVHFPIALFLMAGLAELLLAFRPKADLQQAIRVMVYGGAIGALVAALFGWIHTGIWLGGEGAMIAHRWIGTALAIFGGVAAIAVPGTGGRRLIFRVLLLLIAAALVVQGFLGGELAHGAGHLGS